MIDHNQAFDPDFDPQVFADLHVFAKQWRDVSGDMLKRQEYNQRFSQALANWNSIRESVPQEWLYVDPEMTVPVDISLNMIYESLKRYEREDFWSTL